MKNKITDCLIAFVLFCCLIFGGLSVFIIGQSIDNSANISKDFGYSLRKKQKENKDKAKIEQQNNNTIIVNSPLNDEIIRVDTTMVLNEVLVFDKNGNHIKDLKKEDFTIKDDDELQEISTFIYGDSEAIPRSIVLIIDYSASQLPFIETSIEAAKVLIDKLNPNDRVAIVTDQVDLLQNFTNDKNLLKEKLESLKISALSGKVGLSKQYSALMATLNEVFDENSLRPIVIFQTDGDQFADLKGEVANFNSSNPEALQFSYKDVLTAAEKKRTTIYTIIPGLCINEISEKEKLEKVKTYIEESERISARIKNFNLKPGKPKVSPGLVKGRIVWLEKFEFAITNIAKSTGGSTKCLEQTGQAEQVYSDILSEMNRRYVIGYYPKNQERDGRRRNVETEVRGHPEYKILGRKTYILSKDREY